MSPIQTLDDLIDMLRRRARLLLLVSALGCVFSLLLAMSQKHLYQSTEVLQLTGPTVAGESDTHLRLIRQRLMTRTSLLGVIDAYNLYAEYPEMKPAEMVERLRQSVRFEGGEVEDGVVSFLAITAEMPIAIQARQVAHELARLMIALDEEVRIGQANETLAFFTTQEDRLADEMMALDARVVTMPPGTDASVLARRMRQLHGELEVVSGHRADAEIAFRLETEGQAGRLSVIEPAAVPEGPVANNRKSIAVIGSALSVIAALALGFALDLRHPVIRTATQMERETGFGPVVSIPRLDPIPTKATLWQRFLAWLDGPETSDDPA